MSHDWLYPLSSNTDYTFELSDGRTMNTGPTSFEQMINSGVVDDRWGAFKNWRRASVGDRIWVYYGTADGDIGIVGTATIRRIEPPENPGERATLHLAFDVPRTRRLLRNPLPATEIREFIKHPLAALWAIPEQLAARLHRHAESDPPRPDSQAPVRTTIVYTPPAAISADLRHDAMLLPFQIRLSTAGWAKTDIDIRPMKADLVMRLNGRLLLIEGKTVTGSTRQPVRDAFAQLHEYDWRYKRTIPVGEPIIRWALLESEPKDDEVAFLEAHDIHVSWISKGRFVHGPRTAQVAFEIGM